MNSSTASSDSHPVVDIEERAFQSIQLVLSRAYATGGLTDVVRVCDGLVQEAANLAKIDLLGQSDDAVQRANLAHFVGDVWTAAMLDRLENHECTDNLSALLTGEERLQRIADVIGNLNLGSTS